MAFLSPIDSTETAKIGREVTPPKTDMAQVLNDSEANREMERGRNKVQRDKRTQYLENW